MQSSWVAAHGILCLSTSGRQAPQGGGERPSPPVGISLPLFSNKKPWTRANNPLLVRGAELLLPTLGGRGWPGSVGGREGRVDLQSNPDTLLLCSSQTKYQVGIGLGQESLQESERERRGGEGCGQSDR